MVHEKQREFIDAIIYELLTNGHNGNWKRISKTYIKGLTADKVYLKDRMTIDQFDADKHQLHFELYMPVLIPVIEHRKPEIFYMGVVRKNERPISAGNVSYDDFLYNEIKNGITWLMMMFTKAIDDRKIVVGKSKEEFTVDMERIAIMQFVYGDENKMNKHETTGA